MNPAGMKIAIVSGANRGIGFETCRQLSQQGFLIILTSRDENKGKAAAELLLQEGGDLIYHQLDVADVDSITRLASYLKQNFDRCDILINNAGVFLDRGKSVFNVPLEVLQETLEINFFSVFNM